MGRRAVVPDEQDTIRASRDVSLSPVPSSRDRDEGRGCSDAGWDVVLIGLPWRSCLCKGGDGGKSSVMDRGRQSVPREGQRGDVVRDVTEVGGSTGAATRTAPRDGARQRRRLNLPLAVHTSDRSRQERRAWSRLQQAVLRLGNSAHTRPRTCERSLRHRPSRQTQTCRPSRRPQVTDVSSGEPKQSRCGA